MGTTAQKLNRVLQTKSDLKTVINYSGANITNETTFKDYPKLLNKAYIDILNDEGESLYNALPKTSGSGTTIDLNTEKGKMKIELNSSDLTQSGTPTPDNPQNIHVVRGNNNIKINDGTSEQNYPLSLGSLEYCKIGNYQDYIYNDNGNWYIHKEIGKIVFNGSENWTLHNSNTSRNVYRIIKDDILPYTNNGNIPQILLSHFIPVSNDARWLPGYVSMGIQKSVYLMVEPSYTLATFKTWLSNNSVILYYVLQTPQDTQIADTTLIQQLDNLYNNAKSYNGQTNITQTNEDLPFNLEVSALAKIE